MDEFDKCRFCEYYHELDGCDSSAYCHDHFYFSIDYQKVINKSKDIGTDVGDVIERIYRHK